MEIKDNGDREEISSCIQGKRHFVVFAWQRTVAMIYFLTYYEEKSP